MSFDSTTLLYHIPYPRFKQAPKRLHNAKTRIFMQTIVAPTGVEAKIERRIPKKAQNTEHTADDRITP